MFDISRRHFVVGAGAGFGATLIGANATASPGGGRLSQNPFALGVASGDPLSDSVILWTRLALDPLDESGFAGMPARTVPVQWQVAEDPGMRRVVRRGTFRARPENAHSVHVDVRGLRPGREYWYRFKVMRWLSPIGRTRTAPAPHEMPASLAMAFASCAQYEHGFFTAYRRLAQDHPDLVLHLGDYQYEYRANTYVSPDGNVRDHAGPETCDLASYRQRHAQYKADEDLQSAHAVAPWLVVWDDHEIDNNWAAGVPENTKAEENNGTPAAFAARRRDAFRAYWENMPLRLPQPKGASFRIYRRTQWGRLATFHMMDTRQYRDDQLYGDGWKAKGPEIDTPGRSMTGEAQEKWLLDGFTASRQRWDILGQQVFFAAQDADAGPGEKYSMDAWDGYRANRSRLTKGWTEAGVRNPVVLTGDVHKHWANDLKLDWSDPDSAVVGSELVCSSITSTGDGSHSTTSPNQRINPHLKFYNDDRGYVTTRITPEAMTAEFRSLDIVTKPGADAVTKARFRIEDGVRGLQRA